MLAGLALLAGVYLATDGGRSGQARRLRGLGQTLLPSGAPQGRGVESGAPRELWPIKPEDFVHPAEKMAARRRAESTGGRWAVIGRDGGVHGRFRTRAEAFDALRRAGYGRPKPAPGEAVTVAEAEGWSR